MRFIGAIRRFLFKGLPDDPKYKLLADVDPLVSTPLQWGHQPGEGWEIVRWTDNYGHWDARIKPGKQPGEVLIDWARCLAPRDGGFDSLEPGDFANVLSAVLTKKGNSSGNSSSADTASAGPDSA